jgi:hypothetical protein
MKVQKLYMSCQICAAHADSFVHDLEARAPRIDLNYSKIVTIRTSSLFGLPPIIAPAPRGRDPRCPSRSR